MRLGVVLTAALVFGHGAADAHISDASVFKNITGGASATDENTGIETENVDFGPVTEPATPISDDAFPIDLTVSSGGASASVTGRIRYRITSTEISASARLSHGTSVGSSTTAAAMAGFDVVHAFSFEVDEESEYRVFGWVRSAKNLENSELIACARNGTVLAGDTRATPYPAGTENFDQTRTVFPNETVVVECGAVASGGQTSSDEVEWRFYVWITNSGPHCTDPNGDGQTTASDALTALRAAVNLNNCQLAVCDVNDSASVTASDALGILRLAVGSPFAWACPEPSA